MSLFPPAARSNDRCSPGRRRLWLAVVALAVATALGGAWWGLRPQSASDGSRPLVGNDDRTLPSVTEAGRRPSGAVSVQRSSQVEQRLIRTVRYLASNELEGRGIGTAGIELAAKHIAEEFRGAGLTVNRFDNSPFQRFARSVKFGISGRNEIRLEEPAGVPQSLTLHQDFSPLSLSGSGTFALPLVFAGYGLTAPDIGYDDYRGLDVNDKAVIVLRHGPRQTDRHGPFREARVGEGGGGGKVSEPQAWGQPRPHDAPPAGGQTTPRRHIVTDSVGQGSEPLHASLVLTLRGGNSS